MQDFDAARFRRKSIAVCPQKQRYTTWAEAARVARRARKRDGWDVLEPYKCRACAGYHCGHPPDVDRAG
jgi:hypothetical protein